MVKLSMIAACLVGSALSAPSRLEERAAIPSAEGFPMPNSQQLLVIESAAHGTLPNTPPPPNGTLNNATLTALQVVAFNEIFEAAYFHNLLYNVTNNVTGYTFTDPEYRDFVIRSLKVIYHQEELHGLDANGALMSQGVAPIQPCGTYTFPVDNFLDAVALAQTFTDVVLGTLQSVIKIAAQSGAYNVTAQIAAIVGQEGEQNGAYRVIQKKVPSAQPFLTASSGAYAWTALQMFVVPSTCPSIPTVRVPIFAPLNVLSKPVVNATSLQFSFNVSKIATASMLPAPVSWTTSTNFSEVASVVYINGQNAPISVPIQNPTVSGCMVTFTAPFPQHENLLYGLTLAAVVNGTGPFKTMNEAVNQTVFAPGLIELE